MKRFWLSFCDTDKPAGSQFLGVAIVRAHSLPEAIRVAHVLGINPGGEVQSLELPDGVKIDGGSMEQLLSRVEAEALWQELEAQMEAL